MYALVRLRRHRISIVVAVFLCLILYQFSSLRDVAVGLGEDRLKEYINVKPGTNANTPPTVKNENKQPVSPPPNRPDAPTIEHENKPQGQPVDRPENTPTPVPDPGTQESDPEDLIDDDDEDTNKDIEKPDERPDKDLDDEHPDEEPDDEPEIEPEEETLEETPEEKARPAKATYTPHPQKPVRPGDSKEPLKTATQEHWSRYSEHYPIPTESIIPLPTDKPIAIPQIQADFAPETEENKKVRLHRKEEVKKAFLLSWNAYKKYAWGHDELTPLKAGPKDPFGGWGASLVDALDTLWIMGLKDEFEEAVTAVAKIDFTTTPNVKIAVFETVIRYLGGLLAAWDVSNGKYPVLREKAVELAEVLYGAFDTPNRMPLLSYYWHADDIARKSRAPKKGVAAELGSLTLEFTRLAQITKNNKYFDAVQRITNALDAYQLHTGIPGLWPDHFDASGCKPVRPPPSRVFANPDGEAKSETEPAAPAPKHGITEKPFRVPAVLGGTGNEVSRGPNPLKIVTGKQPVTAAEGVSEQPIAMPAVVGGTGKEVPQDMVAVPNVESEHTDSVTETTTMSDSIGRTGHEHPEHELARSNLKRKVETGKTQFTDDDNDNIDASPKETTTPTSTPTWVPNVATCVPRGLAAPPFSAEQKYGLGAMIDSLYEYLIKEYLLLGGVKAADQYKKMYSTAMDVAGEKLTFRPNVEGSPDVLIPGNIYVKTIEGTRRSAAEGSHLACFAGGMFAMGARALNRPRDLEIGSKLTDGCVWAYSAMRSGIMPETFKVMYCEDKKNCTFSEDAWVKFLEPSESYMEQINQQDAEDYAATVALAAAQAKTNGSATNTDSPIEYKVQEADDAPVHGPQHRKRTPPPPRTAKDFAQAVIETNDLPPGFTALSDRRYILRPEAIESVWYMYRISGERSWQDKGWSMFQATEKATNTVRKGGVGHSAITNVNSLPEDEMFEHTNSMESFWFGETLKYYYLLFETPEVMSLDEWVLNTEAHFFKRPKVPKEEG